MLIGIEPTVDYAFKRVFGRTENVDILISLLNAVLGRPAGQRIASLEILNPFLAQERLDDKEAVLDVKARDESGRLFNVEMQIRPHHALRERMLYYWARVYSSQLVQGEDYTNLTPTISVLFLDDVLFPGVAGAHHRFRLQTDTKDVVFSDQIEFHVLELRKFVKPLPDLGDDLEKWLFFLRYAADLDMDRWPTQLADSPWIRAGKELVMLSQTEIERELYEARRKGHLDYLTDMRVERRIGQQIGQQIGRRDGRIQLLQKLLRIPVSSDDDLEALTSNELDTLAEQLAANARQNGLDI